MDVGLLSSDSESCKGYIGLKGSVNLALSKAGLYIEGVIESFVLGAAAIWDT